MSFVPPSDSENHSVELLKSQLFGDFPELSNNGNFNDTTILRFLRGNKHNNVAAKTSLHNHIVWRKENDVDHIEQRTHEFQKEIDERKVLLGFKDLHGRPACYVHAHNHNAYDRNIEEVRKLSIWTLESLRKAANPKEERFVVCVDLCKFTMRCMDYEAIKQQIHILQVHYPDTLDSCFVIDSPFIFCACWRIIRPWLDPVTASKVHFVKRSELDKFFDVSTLPFDH